MQYMGTMNPTDLIPLILTVLDCVCNLVCRIPQIVRILRLKESKAISVPYWICCILSCGFCITFYFLTGNLPFLITALINLDLNIVVLVLTIRYRVSPASAGEK
ncbi:MAG: hypothetical protein ILO68_06945 [Clostridia bacterium]|nr:hypothetical protein [Clostridia bacterium]